MTGFCLQAVTGSKIAAKKPAAKKVSAAATTKTATRKVSNVLISMLSGVIDSSTWELDCSCKAAIQVQGEGMWKTGVHSTATD